jgi:oligopeptide transport system substrate-binding protein
VRVVIALASVFAALIASISSAAGAGGERAIKDGGTFRIDSPLGGWAVGPFVDPALTGKVDPFRPACGTLMGYPNTPLPAGLRLSPELAVTPPRVSRDGMTYTFTIRATARFSTGKAVTASDVKSSLERVLTPALQSGLSYLFEGVEGARRMLVGKAPTLAGVSARGRVLAVRLVTPVPDFPARTTHLCVVPAGLPAGAEGAKAPIPSAAPYYIAQYVPNERLVLERNTFYVGPRPHYVDRFEHELSGDLAAGLDRVARGEVDTLAPSPLLGPQLAQLARRYGVNRSQFFVRPGLAGRMFFLNTSRPLFRGNPELRRAVNFAVDRAALIREFGAYAATRTDQFLPPGMPGFRDARIYPLDRPDLRKARALAAGHVRSGKAVLYTCTDPGYCVAPAQVLQRNLKAIGLSVQIKRFPPGLLFQKAEILGEPYDIILLGWAGFYNDPREFMLLFDGRSAPVNFSRFNSAAFNRLLDRAGSLSGAARYRAYGDLDVTLARDAAPAIPYAVYNYWAFVSPRVGCVVMNPGLDLTAVCLK